MKRILIYSGNPNKDNLVRVFQESRIIEADLFHKEKMVWIDIMSIGDANRNNSRGELIETIIVEDFNI